jgi:hypothetical protein
MPTTITAHGQRRPVQPKPLLNKHQAPELCQYLTGETTDEARGRDMRQVCRVIKHLNCSKDPLLAFLREP